MNFKRNSTVHRWYIHIHAHILWRNGCLPLIISVFSSLKLPPFARFLTGVGVRDKALSNNQDEAHLNRMEPPLLLNAEHASPRETCLFPCACSLVSSWVLERFPHRHMDWVAKPAVRMGNTRLRRRRARVPGHYFVSCAAASVKMSCWEAATTRTPDQREGAFLVPYLGPSLLNTAPSSRFPGNDEDTRSPVFFGHFFPTSFFPLGHFILFLDIFVLFMLINASPRPDATLTVCRLLLPPEYIWWFGAQVISYY